jgi:hypothetical protein
MLHPAVLSEMLDDEIAAAKLRLGSRASELRREQTNVVLSIGDHLRLILDGARYDAEPFRVTVADTDGRPVPHEQWPGSLSLGVHPIVGRPFACVQGTYEYHAHPSHLEDHWARYRNSIRLADLLDHLLRKAGR